MVTDACSVPRILAVDIGTTAIKAGIIAANGRLCVFRQQATPYHLVQPPVFEVDMDALAAVTLSLLKECLLAEHGSSIAAIAITAQGDGVWSLDHAGRPAGPALIWRDSRSNEMLRRWRSEGRLSAVAHVTGTCPTSAHQTTQMAWLKRHLPDRVAPMRHLVFAEDWIGYVLTGRIGVSIASFEHTYGHARPPDYSFSQSAAQVLSLLDLEWMQALLVEPTSPLQPRGGVLPEMAKHLGVKAGTPVYVGPFDVLTAAIGTGAVLPSQGSSIWGTAAIHQRWVTSRAPSEIGYLVSHPQKRDRWLRFVATSAGMVNLDYWRRILYPDVEAVVQWTWLESTLTQYFPEVGSLIYLPYLSAADERSEEAPGLSGAAFLGVQEHHRREHFLCAVYEGLTVQAARIFRRLSQMDVPFEEVRVAGGGAQSTLLTQLLAQATNVRVVQPRCIEASLLGAAIIALTALGYATDLDVLAQSFNPVQAIYSPDATSISRYQDLANLIDILSRQLTGISNR